MIKLMLKHGVLPILKHWEMLPASQALCTEHGVNVVVVTFSLSGLSAIVCLPSLW